MSSYVQASMDLDTVNEWSPDPDGCLDQFTTAAHVCSGVESQNCWLLRAGAEGCQKQLRTLMRDV